MGLQRLLEHLKLAWKGCLVPLFSEEQELDSFFELQNRTSLRQLVPYLGILLMRCISCDLLKLCNTGLKDFIE